MTKAKIRQEALRMPLSERLDLAEALWSSIEDESREPSLLPLWQRQILDARVDADEKHPVRGSSWSDVKKRILSSL